MEISCARLKLENTAIKNIIDTIFIFYTDNADLLLTRSRAYLSKSAKLVKSKALNFAINLFESLVFVTLIHSSCSFPENIEQLEHSEQIINYN
jgi:hypothetical protein